MKKSDVLKKFLPILCILVTVVTIVSIFAACSKEKDTPYGSLSDNAYMTINKNGINFSISEKELYDQMKYNGYDQLKKSLEKEIFASQIETVKNGVASNDEEIMKELKDMINKACYGTDEEEDIADIKAKDKKTYIKKYYDSLFAAGVDVKIVGSNAYNEADLYSNAVLENYYLDLAKKLYATEKLKEDIKNEESDYYIDTDEEYPTYFDSNIKNTDDVSVLMVQFSSESESENILKDLHLKFISGKLYYIPIGSKTKTEYNTYYNGYDVISEGATALTSIQTLIEFVRIYNYVYSYREPITITYGTNTTNLISTSTSDDSSKTEMEQVSDYYLDNYNTATDAAKKLSEEIIEFANTTKNQESFNQIKVTFEKEDLEKFDATACSYIYSTLSLEGYTDPSEIFFTPKLQSGSSKSYIAYKLAEGITLDWDELKDEVKNEADENGKYHTYYNDSLAKIEEDMFDEKLTDAYINEVVENLYKDDLFENDKIEIYDPLLEIIYKVNNDGYKKNNEKSKDAVASVEIDGTKHYVYVDDFYQTLERMYGTNTAYNLAGDVILNNLYLDKINDEKIKELTDDFEALLAGFSAGNMQSSGYDPKIGKEAFLKTYLKVSSSQEAINRIYIRQEEEKLFYEDYDLHAKLFGFSAYNEDSFGSLNVQRNKDDLFKALADLAKLEYDEYFNISYRNILVYTDFDNDGNPDDPKDYDFNPNSKTEADADGRPGKAFRIQTSAGVYEEYSFIELSNNLIQRVITEAKKSQTVNAGLDAISTYYSNANKYNVLDAADIYYSSDKVQAMTDTLWGEYKRLGLELKIEANTSSTNDAKLTLDEDFFNNLNSFYVKYLKNDEKNTTGWTNTFYGIIDEENIQKDSDDKIIINDEFKTTGLNNLIATQFGYHVIYVTGGNLGESAEFDSDIDDEGFRGDKIYPADINNNDNKFLSDKQIGGYLEDDSDNKEKIAPVVKTAINSYFTSLNDKYTNTLFQSYYTHLLIYSYYDCQFSDSASNVLEAHVQVMKNSINSYNDDVNAYNQWWAMFDQTKAF